MIGDAAGFMRQLQENRLSALCHAVNIIPFWGLVICGIVFFKVREESRRVQGQALQAMVFHAMLLGVTAVFFILQLLVRVLRVISAGLSEGLEAVNQGMVAVIFVVFAAFCLLGCVRCLRGEAFHYPLVRLPQ